MRREIVHLRIAYELRGLFINLIMMIIKLEYV